MVEWADGATRIRDGDGRELLDRALLRVPQMRVRRGLAWVAGLALLSACTATGDVPDERFVRFFDELTFGDGVDGERRERVSRWDGPLHFEVQGDAAFADEAVRVVAAVARMAGLPDQPERRSGAPLVIRQEPAGKSFPVNRDRVDCYVHYRRRDGGIVAADIHIAASEPTRVTLCLYHELLHTLGLGHSGAIASVMSPFHATTAPTRWDAMAAHFIMSGSVGSGMRRSAVLARLEAELSELRHWPERLPPVSAGDATRRPSS